MAYWLEKRVVQGSGKLSQVIWKRYAACGNSELLERVRMGQKCPEHWRVVMESADSSAIHMTHLLQDTCGEMSYTSVLTTQSAA